MLQQQFFNLKLEGMDMAVYISKVEDIRNRIKQQGEEVPERMVVSKILNS